MRILVADQNAFMLAAITATFGPHCDLVTASRRDICLAQLEQHKFDVVIAGDKLSDYTGLELLSEVPVISPDTLLIFAADPKRLQQMDKRLALFGLFEAISYPLTPQKLVEVLKRAREKLQASRPQPKVRHVVLESEWDTGERLGLIEQGLQDGDDFVFAGPPTVQAAGSTSAERLLEGTPVVTAAGVPDSSAAPNRAAAGRTFEGTPVISASEAVVTEYEVKPSLPALTHSHTASVECEDEFIFAAAFEATAADLPVTQEATPALEEDELETAPESEADFLGSNDPVFDVPQPPKWAEDGAANDTAFEGKRRDVALQTSAPRANAPELPAPPARSANASRARADSKKDTETPKSAPSSPKSAKDGNAAAASSQSPKGPAQPRVRTQTVPTEAQRLAFERAVARRNAGLGPESAPTEGGRKNGRTQPTIKLGSTAGVFSGLPLSGRPSKSLTDLAKMATSKRPLPDTKLGKAVPKKAVFAVGSGVAAVLILGVLSFELLRNSGEAEHHMPHAQAQSTQLFSSSTTMMASRDGGPAQLVAPPAEQMSQQDGQPDQPQAQTFDADTAPPDPPPPPALEHPGPSEPPSMGNTDVPPWALTEQQPWGTTSSSESRDTSHD